VVTNCGRICLGHKKINFSTVFAGQAVGIKEVHDDIWLVSSMDYDLGYFRSGDARVRTARKSIRPKSEFSRNVRVEPGKISRERTTKMKQQSV